MPSARARTLTDLVAASALAVAAAFATSAAPGSTVRVALVLPVLFCVPGYLLVQAVTVPAAPPSRRLLHLVYGLGLSPPIVGLAALATSIVGAFQPGPIVASVTLCTLALATVAAVRRLRPQAMAAPQAEPAASPVES